MNDDDKLEKLLYAAGGVDQFLQWLMSEIDDLEDDLFDPEKVHEVEELAKELGEYETLLKVRDTYCDFQQKKS